ncbi:MAG TPA: phytanoyl-CoA dioxygenase family protein [Thermoleophilaceae bacterium]|jgi:ectoine hydroxylase-related dioxygenase (phytanoyl-CoA dioxygenase family)
MDTLPTTDLTAAQLESFRRDGFLIIEEGFVSDGAVETLRERFDALFAGDYSTGIAPDEVNWKAGRDPEDRTRQICNGWRADDLIAAQVTSERTGRLAATLMGYRGVRLLQDNCLWKPPGAKSLGMHQDGSYAGYLVPPEMVTCWIALDDTRAEGGTIEYVPGSHRWPRTPPSRSEFHAPDDWLAPVREASPDGDEPARVPVVVKAGGASFHHSLMFHGSGPNQATSHRRAIVSHLLPVEARFHPTDVDLIYSRYRRRGDLSLDESFFPVTYDETGGRSQWLAALPALD